MTDFSLYKRSLSSIKHYVYALCEVDGNKRTPFYIGKGEGERCLHHLKESGTSEKVDKIQKLLSLNKLGIDILRHGIESDKVAKTIESTCIDLLGIGELTNKVKGSGASMGRVSIEEIHNLQSGELIDVSHEHMGLAFLLNSTYKSGMTELQLYESTRGDWFKVPRDESLKYAYATYGGLIKEVYEIHGWVRAGTQECFSISIEDRSIENRWEFIGRKASNDVRRKYIGKVLNKPRSYGHPFVKVGAKS